MYSTLCTVISEIILSSLNNQAIYTFLPFKCQPLCLEVWLWETISAIHNLKERFKLAHRFRGVSPWLVSGGAWWRKSTHTHWPGSRAGSRGREEGVKSSYTPSSHLRDPPRHTQKCVLSTPWVTFKTVKLALNLFLGSHETENYFRNVSKIWMIWTEWRQKFYKYQS